MRQAVEESAGRSAGLGWERSPVAAETVSGWCELAARGLERMFDRQSGLFCFTLRLTPQGLRPLRRHVRYTPIALLGLHRWAESGQRPPLELRDTLARLLRDPRRIDNAGDLGLVLWACAHILPGEVRPTCRRLKVEGALETYPDARARKTTELAWLLTGLTCCAGVARGEPLLAELARRTHQLLMNNHVPATGLFCHLGHGRLRSSHTWHRAPEFLRRRVCNFADQIYSVYALARFAETFGAPEALEAARRCAATLCRLQGVLGQWWWHYDAPTGRVIGRYPVYAVHQHGMAPLALFALSEVSGQDFSGAALRGLPWIRGGNELGRDLIENSERLIWRDLRPPRLWRQRAEEALSLLGLPPAASPKVIVNRECRPYELGWLLYAFAGRC